MHHKARIKRAMQDDEVVAEEIKTVIAVKKRGKLKTG